MFNPEDFFNLTEFDHKKIFEGIEYVWDVLKKINLYINQVIKPEILGDLMDGSVLIGNDIFVGEGSVIEPGAFIKGPTIIGKNTEVRQGAYIRGNVLVGNECIVGHTTEMKNVIMLNGAKAPHFAYIGDSVLGNKVNLGAGTKISNLKLGDGIIKVKINEKVYDTGLRKFGAIMGDNTETGCNCVLNPGAILGKGCLVYPNVSLGNKYYQSNTIIKLRQNLEETERLIR